MDDEEFEKWQRINASGFGNLASLIGNNAGEIITKAHTMSDSEVRSWKRSFEDCLESHQKVYDRISNATIEDLDQRFPIETFRQARETLPIVKTKLLEAISHLRKYSQAQRKTKARREQIIIAGTELFNLATKMVGLTEQFNAHNGHRYFEFRREADRRYRLQFQKPR